ncbi:unnamed protein product [Durusdinium trenchii]|uniref:Fe2OG dioxygenase domain-containing protein n=1 Tax=Durusdinium trenchii TaxID=1381693 RepID=A0ABP0SH97_9DINO
MAEYLQSYAEALQERLEPFPEDEMWDSTDPENDGEDSNSEGYRSESSFEDDFHFPSYEFLGSVRFRKGYSIPSLNYSRMIALSFNLPQVVGHSLVGEEIFTLFLDQPCTSISTDTLISAISAVLGADPLSLTLLSEGVPLEPDQMLGDALNAIAVRQRLDTGPPVLVCERRSHNSPETLLGRPCHVDVNLNYFPGPGIATIQAIPETREFVTRDRFDSWMIYTKLEVLQYQRPSEKRCRRDLLKPRGFFPRAPAWSLPDGCQRWGHGADVWSATFALPNIKRLMDAHAECTADRPIPRYQMIIDPNQFVRHTEEGPVWVPCEFDVDSCGRAQLVGGTRSHQHPDLARQVALPILEASLPLLAKLRRPQLLLDRRRLQAVFKAQRIILPPKVGEDHESEYIGMWHVDGHREDVVAVALYYYHVDSALEGGDMEFCGREPLDVLAIADAGHNASSFDKASLKKALVDNKIRCRVPICEGTLLVFSNHQLVHRVLRMINKSGSEASRDFVALFILNPASTPLVPSRCALAKQQMLTRTLRPSGLPPENIQAILALAGILPTEEYAKELRNVLLSEQLKPTGEFVGRQQNVHATGNGCVTMVGWLHHMLQESQPPSWDYPRDFSPGWKHFRALNRAPGKLGRGISEVFSKGSSDLSSSEACCKIPTVFQPFVV